MRGVLLDLHADGGEKRLMERLAVRPWKDAHEWRGGRRVAFSVGWCDSEWARCGAVDGGRLAVFVNDAQFAP